MSRSRAAWVIGAVLLVALAGVAVSGTVPTDGGVAAPGSSETEPTEASVVASQSTAMALETSGSSARIDSTGGVDGAWTQTVTVEPDTEYTLRGWIETEDVDAGTGEGALLTVDGTDVRTDVLTGSAPWTHVSTTFTTDADTTEVQVNALLGGSGESTGTAWFDGLALEGPAGENLLENGDFEDDENAWVTEEWSGAGEYTVSDQRSIATGAVTSRTVEDPRVEPGDSTRVTVEADLDSTTDFTIVEQISPAGATVELVDADGANVAAVRESNDEVFATFTDRDRATLVYEVTIPESSEPSDYRLVGFAHSHGERSVTGGPDAVIPDTGSFAPDTAAATRSIDVASDDGTATVTLDVTAEESADFTVFESFDPAFESVEIVDADGADLAGVREDGSGLYATYGDRTAVTLVYEVAYDDDLVDDYAFDGYSTTAANKGSLEAQTVGDDAFTDGEDDPIELNGYEPQPYEGSDLYYDVDGSATLGSNDVVVFFAYLEDPAVQSNPQYFDFDGNGQVSISDVVALFQEL